MAMFIRVKRKKTTYFLHCDPTETVLEIKQKIQALSDNPVDCQRLILVGSQLLLDDHKSLADQKIVEGLDGGLLEDAKTLAEQQVENDAIVALCLKISDPRVHRIPTLMRAPSSPPTLPPSPTPPPENVEEVILEPGEEPPPSLPPERRMSTELRVPYRLPTKENDTELGEKDSSLRGIASMTDGLKKKSVKKETQKEGSKTEAKKEAAKKDTSKKDGSKKGVGGAKKPGKESLGRVGKEFSKKGGKKALKEEVPPPSAEIVEPKEDGVWEDITIDKLEYDSD